MSQRLEEKDRQRLIVLEALYDNTDGRTDAFCYTDEFFKILAKRGISKSDVDVALKWLHGEGLGGYIASGMVGITHEGAREVEDARRNPNRGTDHFSPTIIQNVNNNNFYGAVGGVQQGSHNSMNVAQQFNAPAAIIDHFAAIRREIEKLPDDKKSEATDLVEAMEAEAQKPAPKHVIFASYATALAALVTSAAPHIPPLLDWISHLNK